MGDLTEHFSRSEFQCKCCGDLVLDERLPAALEILRKIAGRPIRVNCGYRCPQHNERVGGERNSQHTHGRAADIVIPGIPVMEMYELAQRVPDFLEGGIGVYPAQGFIHVDVRRGRARWGKVGRRMVGIEEVARSERRDGPAEVGGDA